MLCIRSGQLEDECLYCSGAKSTPPGWTAWRSSVVVVWCRYCAHLVPRCLLLQLVRVTGAGVPWAKVTNSFSYIEVLWERDGVPGPCGPQGGQARDLKWDRRAWLGSRVVYLVKLVWAKPTTVHGLCRQHREITSPPSLPPCLEIRLCQLVGEQHGGALLGCVFSQLSLLC